MFSKKDNKKNKKQDSSILDAMSSALFGDSISESNLKLTLTANLSPAGGYQCTIENPGKRKVTISHFCINNYAFAIRNSGIGRNFYGTLEGGQVKSFDIEFVGQELATRDPILFNFLYHADSVVLFVSDKGKPFRISDITRN